jgi:1-deoxy-D-xylulose-5-phosphate reductoisomerase
LKRVAILGSTGSIGTQTLDVVRANPGALEVVALAARSSADELDAQAAEFRVAKTALFDKDGMAALLDIATDPEVDVVVVSVSGMIGLEPTLAALDAGKAVALASKEVLVAGGEIVMPKASAETLRPIDSEHSAVLQCLQGEKIGQVERIILTASGGPFRGWDRGMLENATLEQALAHPTWHMGGKITIDSATLMNKGLELIEATWLFGVAPDIVDIVVHPQSIIHSMVKFRDGSVLGQMGQPNMKLPIQYALLGPERVPSPAPQWNPADSPNLELLPLDESTFSLPGVAREAMRLGGLTPTYMNAVNEEAANAFLRGEIGFMDITRACERSLGLPIKGDVTLESILACDAEARANWKTLATPGNV